MIVQPKATYMFPLGICRLTCIHIVYRRESRYCVTFVEYRCSVPTWRHNRDLEEILQCEVILREETPCLNLPHVLALVPRASKCERFLLVTVAFMLHVNAMIHSKFEIWRPGFWTRGNLVEGFCGDQCAGWCYL